MTEPAQNTPSRMLTLKQAAEYLNQSYYTVRRLAIEGKLPAGRIGSRWRLLQEDLVTYVRSQYATPDASQGVIERSNNSWHYVSEVKRGGFTSATMENAYNEALGLATK